MTKNEVINFISKYLYSIDSGDIILTGSFALSLFEAVEREKFDSLDIIVSDADFKRKLEDTILDQAVREPGFVSYMLNNLSIDKSRLSIDVNNQLIDIIIFVSDEPNKINVIDNLYISEPISTFEAKQKFAGKKDNFYSDRLTFEKSRYYKNSKRWYGKVFNKVFGWVVSSMLLDEIRPRVLPEYMEVNEFGRF